MGPFELMDQVGLDVGHHVGEMLKDAFGDRIGSPDTVIGKLVEDGRLGQKNGRGFYHYKKGKPTTPDASVYGFASNPAARDLPPEMLEERLVLTMVNEAALCLEEGVARSARDLDMAMIMGTGFPPFRGGLLRHADVVGISAVVDRLSRLAEAQGTRFRPTERLQRMARDGATFHDR